MHRLLASSCFCVIASSPPLATLVVYPGWLARVPPTTLLVLQWPLGAVFSLAYGSTRLLFGRMGDIYSGRILFLAGSAWFAVWSIGTALARNLTTIILFMVGAAANTPAGIGIIVSHFPPGTQRNTILGLVLGGLLSQSKATLRTIFYVQAALGALFVLLGIIYLPSSSSSPNSSNSKSKPRQEKEPAYLPTLRAASPLHLPALYRTGSASAHRPSFDGNGGWAEEQDVDG
ncbi:hypothetical protein DFH06DRAFT_1467509 [Mycena polygramma]|nr:hypothetical protein DFH06DRAFT_1482812 [Mycena polygramma]KAJ7673114.1 hypothetical protein DFH06DRAFT_1467509 [Mycena polygramma]